MKTLTKESTSSRVGKPTDLSELLEAFDQRHLKKVSGGKVDRDGIAAN